MVKVIRASALVLLLACSAQAGYMQNDAPAPPPPAPPVSARQEPTNSPQEMSANGYMQNGAPSGVTQIALEVLAVLPSLF